MQHISPDEPVILALRTDLNNLSDSVQGTMQLLVKGNATAMQVMHEQILRLERQVLDLNARLTDLEGPDNVQQVGG